jgi:glycosyltransferase involved in cell wall biosynthesis
VTALSRGLRALIRLILAGLAGVVLLPAALVLRVRRRRRLLVFAPLPIISNKYWAAAMRAAGQEAMSLVRGVYPINEAGDFDRSIDDVLPRWVVPGAFRRQLSSYAAELYVLRKAAVLHIPLSGGPLGDTPLARLEAHLLRWAGVRVVALPYGGDFYQYSKVADPSLRHALLLSYPDAARHERAIERRVSYWTRHADAFLPGYQLDGIGRWDAAAFCCFVIDTDEWAPSARAGHDGADGPVRIAHAPNHRGFKGTEFVVAAVEQLRSEGLDVELDLIEGVKNNEVRARLDAADILVEQLIATGYAMNAIEGMACGLPVLANLEDEAITRLFRRWSYLDECPVVSTAPETIVANLRALVRQPELRQALGRASRAYAEKYHSYATAQHLFGAVHDKILRRKDVDLMRLFDPRTGEYGRSQPQVVHPLIESRLPASAFADPSSNDT